MQRRTFIKYLTPAAAAVLYSCKPPKERIFSNVYPVEYSNPGKHIYYSTVYTDGPEVYGIEVKTIDNRPVKIEGNPVHPVNLGGSSAKMQASLYSLYDPKRMKYPKVEDEETSLETALEEFREMISKNLSSDKKIRIVLGGTSSPSLYNLIEQVQVKDQLVIYNVQEENYPLLINSFSKHGNDIILAPEIREADNIISFDYDFLGGGAYSLYHTRLFGENRNPLFKILHQKILTVESSLSLTGIKSYKRFSLSPIEIRQLFNYIFRSKTNNKIGKIIEIGEYLENTIYEDPRKTAILAGNLVLTDLEKIKNIRCSGINNNSTDKTFKGDQIFFDDLKGFSTGLLILLSKQYLNSPTNYEEELINNIPQKISLVLFDHKESIYTNIKFAERHYLESWGDALSIGNVYSVRQPVISGLYPDAVSREELIFEIAKIVKPEIYSAYESYYEYQKDFTQKYLMAEKSWEELLRDGFVELKSEKNEVAPDFRNQIIPNIRRDFDPDSLLCQLKPSVFYSINHYRNPILDEIPDPVTKLSYQKAALINQKTADKYNVGTGDLISIKTKNGQIELPVFINDMIADNTVSIDACFGNKLKKYNSDPDIFTIEISLTGNSEKIYTPQKPNHIYEKEVKVSGIDSIDEFLPAIRQESFYPKVEYKGPKWGMIISMDVCTGCSACVAACRIENNIPVIGKSEIQKGRSLDWIRHENIYYEDEDEKRIKGMLLLCQQCDNAPCEGVCPVYASVHNPEGLNETVYNRCIGSRYCMANCPYTVRNFNYANYHSKDGEQLNIMLNPEVTVRSRGVVEKCTFCIQRINRAEKKASNEGFDKIPDGYFQTACQQACPAGAITFGDMNDPDSKISKMIKSENNSYKLLENYNTGPSITYLPERY